MVTRFRYANQLRPHYAQLRDYTFKNPDWTPEFTQDKRDEYSETAYFSYNYFHYDYPGRFKHTEQSELYTRARIDSLRRDANIGSGETNDIEFKLAQLVRLNNHPTEKFNRVWKLTLVHQQGRQPSALMAENQKDQADACELTTRFEFMPRNQNYRANFPQKPQISGPQTAVVVGPPNEEIFTDNQGRVKVQFHWDRYHERNDRSSCWIRVASPWVGQLWGMLALPRIGQEVIVSFQEGDPDQPIITGRVYNAIQVPPGNLPSTRTQMHIRSKTYKGDGYNSIMFDDATNQELFEMHAERDMHILVEHDQKNHIKNDRTLTVDSTQTTTIGKGRTETIITGNQVKSVLAGNDITTVSNLKSTQAREIFKYAQDRIELEVGEQTSITMDNEKILLRFGKNTILMDKTGIWIDGVHIGLQEKNISKENMLGEPNTMFALQYQLLDKKNNPYSFSEYIAYYNGKVISSGKTDENGFTEKFYDDYGYDVFIHLLNTNSINA